MSQENETLVMDIQKSFLKLLGDYLPKDIFEKAKEKQLLRVISIACGRFREAKCISNYFSEYKKSIKLYGIEIDKELLDLAKNEPVIKENKDGVYLKLADATCIESYKDWLSDGLFDLIIVRHPEITFNSDPFIKIFTICSNNLLSKEGYLFITTHFENEKETLKLLLKLLKLNILVEAENKIAPSLKVQGEDSYVDKFLLVANK